MKKQILFLTSLSLILSCKVLAQDIHSIFNKQLTLDTQLSKQTKAIDALMKAYGEVQTKVYSYDGSFEEAVNNMNVPPNADVGAVNNQPLSGTFGVFMLMTKDQNPKPMSDAWYDKATEKANALSNVFGKTMSVTISPVNMQNPDNLKVGDKVEIRIISLNNPYVDLDNLKVIEGTWVSDILASTIITQEIMDSDSEDFDQAWDEEGNDMGVALPSGAHFVGLDDVADSELLQGDVNYVVEMSDDQVIEFIKNGQELFVYSMEQSESYSQEGAMITYFDLLKHEGELKTGDEVVSVTIQPAPKSILSDALGRNQGTWTLISISRWTEDDH